MSEPEILNNVPKFLGMVSVEKIINEEGRDVSEEFYLDCAYKMERINGRFVKGIPPELQGVVEKFKSKGIVRCSDISYVQTEEGRYVLVDFSVKELLI